MEESLGARDPAKTRLRILVVEDDLLVGELLELLLVHLGFETCGVVTTETEAVDACARLLPDLMIVDLELASGSGAGAMARILALGVMPHVYAVGNPWKVLRAQPDAIVLHKPYREPDLLAAIAKAMIPPVALAPA